MQRASHYPCRFDVTSPVLDFFGFLVVVFSFLSNASRWSSFVCRNIPVDIDLDNDGTQLGGVLVVGAGDSGILYEYKEKVFGGTMRTHASC